MRQRGFTLIELLAVVVILGITAIGVFSFLRFGAEIFIDTVGRDQLSQQSRFAMERVSRELRGALPGSIRISSNNECIEFKPIVWSGRYLELPNQQNDFEMTVITPAIGFPDQVEYIVVAGYTAAQIYDGVGNRRNDFAASMVTGDGDFSVINFPSNSRFSSNSVAERFYGIGATIEWCAVGMQLTREQSGSTAVMASQLDNIALAQETFSLQSATQRSNALVQIQFYFSRSDSAEPLILYHQVQVRNVQ